MPIITAAIDPITRIEGHLKVNVHIDTVNGVQQVVDAWSVGTLFRGFEKILEGRDPRDAVILTSRICGVCPTAHAKVAALALDDAFGASVSDPGRLMRNLVHGASFLESDILHFYLLCLPDYIQGPGMAPWLPGLELGRRIDRPTADSLRGHYLQAIAMRRKAHEMGAIYGGKLPHTPAFIVGGFTAVSSTQDKSDFQGYLSELTQFIRGTYIPDVERLAALFDDYYQIGRGPANLLSFGTFRQDAAGTSKLMRAGRVEAGSATVLPVDVAQITEQVTHSWYDEASNGQHPSAGTTLPQHPKEGGYSWLKAPRYGSTVYEVGSLARMTVNGDYTNGVSVMDRHLARAYEALKIAQAMQTWLDDLPVDTTAYTPVTPVQTGSGVGLTEAPRGALGHWLEVSGGVVSRYQVITPTCWNCSPRDTAGRRGAMEEGLVGTPVENADQPVEVLRVVHSFDPCLDCATHVMRPGKDATVYRFGRPPAPVRGRG